MQCPAHMIEVLSLHYSRQDKGADSVIFFSASYFKEKNQLFLLFRSILQNSLKYNVSYVILVQHILLSSTISTIQRYF